MKITEIDEVSYGTYVWIMPDGKIVTDEDGNYMCIFSTKGNAAKIKAFKDFAKAHGLTEGKPHFISGARPVTDEEYQEQKQRMEFGLVPDEKDYAAIKEDFLQKRKMGLL